MPDSDNGRVTVARLGQKIDNLIGTVEKIDKKLDEDHDRGIRNEKQIEANCSGIKANKDDIKVQKTRSYWIDGAVGILALIGTAIGINK